MDAEQKSKVEQRAVLVLLGLFGLVLVGSLKSLGLFGGGASSPQLSQTITDVPSAIKLPDVARQAQVEPKLEAINDAGSVVDSKYQLLHAVSYTADTLRDPFQSLLPEIVSPTDQRIDEAAAPSHTAPRPSFTVQGVIWGGTRPQAIIDGDVYSVGDVVQGIRIVSIGHRSVTVESEGTTFEVLLP